jgi:activating signal cointegrator complex subunit 1
MSSVAISHSNASGTAAEKQSRAQQAPHREGPPTHFLAFPLINSHSLPQLSRALRQFQETTTAPRPLRPSEARARERQRNEETPERDVRTTTHEIAPDALQQSTAQLKIIPEKAHRPVGTLHLTLGVMALEDDNAIQRATALLKGDAFRDLLRGSSQEVNVMAPSVGNCQTLSSLRGAEKAPEAVGTSTDAAEQVAEAIQTLHRPISPPIKDTQKTDTAHSQLCIDLKGLGIFPSPTKARVFYAEPHDPAYRLQSFAEAVRAHFVDAGIIRKENRKLTLHATIANTKYVKSFRSGRGSRNSRDIDASSLVEDMKDHVWAEGIVIDRVRICKMGAVKSEDPVLGMEYPAIKVPLEGGGEEVAEVRM